jgi:hypothetical protein
MEEEHVILSFKGVVTAELLTSVLHIMESRMESLQEPPKLRKKVFNVLVECLQNLYHHVDEHANLLTVPDLEKCSALVMISKQDNGFMIRTGNYIENAKASELKLKLQMINSMDSDALRQYYQQNLEYSMLSEKGTAGLGIIDIARKSGNKLDFQFLKVNAETSFFCLNVKIDG